MIAIVAVTICCLADPLTPWVNLQSGNPPADLQIDSSRILRAEYKGNAQPLHAK